MRSVRSVVRTLIAVLLAGFCPLLIAASVQASVQETQPRSSGTTRADSHPLTLSIDKVSPQYASSTSTVTVSGTLSNHTGSAIPDIEVQLQSYPSAFLTRSGMASFSSGKSVPGTVPGSVTLQAGQISLQSMGVPYSLSATLANGATTHWKVSFNPVQSYGAYGIVPGFGVYPLQVQATSSGSSDQATAQTFLPFWPGNDGAARPTPLQVAWVWPLIDTPQQGACAQTLATSSLASSLASNGRLSTLLNTGAQWAAQDDLTWAIDPALLSDATVMTQPYFTGGDSACKGRNPHKTPSAAATKWLSDLRSDTAGEPAFATPYADVDAATLSHNGLDANLRSAYQLGQAEASKVLPGTFGGTGGGSGAAAALAAAWPTDGIADAGVLNSLASAGGVNTVVLSSAELPTSAPLYDNALARTKTSSGTSLSVLLADSGITGILGSASADGSAAAQFAVTQDFLAQTAMILAEAPNPHRSLVVAPPTGWDPSAAEAGKLLQLTLTKNAPWLRPTDLGTLATKAATVSVKKLRTKQVSKAELSDEYVDQLESLNATLAQYENLLAPSSKTNPAPLDAAVAVTESAAWRGQGSPGGWLALTRLVTSLNDQENEVAIIASKKVLLAGTSGNTPVSVTNGLNVPVQVEVRVSVPPGSTLQVGSYERLLTVNAHMTQTVRIPVSSSGGGVGTTTMQLQLFTRNGTPLTDTKANASMSVEVTRFGRTLLVVIGGALGVLVLTVIIRLRRKRRASATHGGGADDRANGNRADGNAESRAHAGGAG
jgi:Family of unknown function (DUF6049)